MTVTGQDDPITLGGETQTASVTGLGKGTYTVCFTVEGQDAYEQCFEVNIAEPKALKCVYRRGQRLQERQASNLTAHLLTL